MVVDSPTVEIEDGEISSSHDQKEVTTKMQGLSTAATLEPSLRSKAYAMIEKQVVELKNKEAVLHKLGMLWAWATKTKGASKLENHDLYSRQLDRFYSRFNQKIETSSMEDEEKHEVAEPEPAFLEWLTK